MASSKFKVLKLAGLDKVRIVLKVSTFPKCIDRSLIIILDNFTEELMKIIEDPDIVMYTYKKSGKISTIYYYNDDIKQDRKKHDMIFEK